MIVVVGSTGSTGLEVVRQLTARGQRVRATARDLEKARALHRSAGVDPSQVELVRCDLEHEETLEPALAGAEKCYVAVGGATGTPKLVDVECRFIDAARRMGVRHYVRVSGIGARTTGISKIERIHGSISDYLIASGLPYTVLEPSFFMQNFLGLAPMIRAGVLALPTGSAKAGLIDARDIAKVATAVLLGDGHAGGRYVLTGPELLSHDDAAQIFGRVLERPIAFQDLPQEAFERSLCGAGVPPWFADLLADVYGTLFRSGGAARLSDDVQRITGEPPRPLAAFVREHRAAFAV